MATVKLEARLAKLLEQCEKLALQLTGLTEEDLAKPTTRRWAPTVGAYVTGTARHKRDHIQQIATKRAALGLEQASPLKALADVIAAQGELCGALIGLTDEDLDKVPAGQNWSIDQVLEHAINSQDGFLAEMEKIVEG